MGEAIIKCSWTLLMSPETLRKYEAILPGSANRLLTLAEREQKQRARVKLWTLVYGFVLALALIALSAYGVSLGFDWAALVIIYCGLAGAAVIFIFK